MTLLTSSMWLFKAYFFYFLFDYFFVFNVFSATCSAEKKQFLPASSQNAAYSCPGPIPFCKANDKFYSADGSCNNIAHPRWGQASTGYIRIVASNYSDGVSNYRKQSDGSPLPLARVISTQIFTDINTYTNVYNILYYGFGQWFDHDITLSVPQRVLADCCDGLKAKSNTPENNCMPTVIPSNDYYYSQFSVTCVDVKRSINTRTIGCPLRPVYQINFQTSYADLSILYGANSAITNSLRAFTGGRLRTGPKQTSGQDFPPVIQFGCPVGGLKPIPGGPCFAMGDIRILQNPELTVNEVLFLRLHNHIADGLSRTNPTWNDQKLFAWTRRILIAIYQHVVYNEWIGPLIGTNAMTANNLTPMKSGYATGYDPNMNGQTTESFEAAAGRILHSLIRGTVSYKNDLGMPQTYNLQNKYFNQEFLLQGNTFTRIIEAYVNSKGSEQDQFVTKDVTNNLFLSETQVFGQDLIAIDINRARDHGLPPYNEYRKACGLCPVASFDDLTPLLRNSQRNIAILKKLYKNIEDVDFYVLGALEKPVTGGMVGETMACILGETFRKNKYGDRLFYEFESTGFTLAQIQDIRTTTYSKLLCLTNNISSIEQFSFLIPGIGNPTVKCHSLGDVDFALYKNV